MLFQGKCNFKKHLKTEATALPDRFLCLGQNSHNTNTNSKMAQLFNSLKSTLVLGEKIFSTGYACMAIYTREHKAKPIETAR